MKNKNKWFLIVAIIGMALTSNAITITQLPADLSSPAAPALATPSLRHFSLPVHQSWWDNIWDAWRNRCTKQTAPEVASVPEAGSTVLMLSAGLVAMTLVHRRKA